MPHEFLHLADVSGEPYNLHVPIILSNQLFPNLFHTPQAMTSVAPPTTGKRRLADMGSLMTVHDEVVQVVAKKKVNGFMGFRGELHILTASIIPCII